MAPYCTGVPDDEHRELVEAITRVLVATARSRSTVTYRTLVADLASVDRSALEAELPSLLREISIDENAAGRGLLTSIVVRDDTGLPGGGFFKLATELGRATSDRGEVWREEVERVYDAHLGTPSHDSRGVNVPSLRAGI